MKSKDLCSKKVKSENMHKILQTTPVLMTHISKYIHAIIFIGYNTGFIRTEIIVYINCWFIPSTGNIVWHRVVVQKIIVE